MAYIDHYMAPSSKRSRTRPFQGRNQDSNPHGATIINAVLA